MAFSSLFVCFSLKLIFYVLAPSDTQILPVLTLKAIFYILAPSDTQILPVLTENRQQTTELRINMGKVSDKVDRILEKVNCKDMFISRIPLLKKLLLFEGQL